MIEHDYEEFKQSEPVSPPQAVSERILARVAEDLNPSVIGVFSKLAVVHVITALFTLSVCPQFGWGFAGEGTGLKELFMSFGPYGCEIACGTFFLGATLLVASFVLNRDELRCLRRNRWLQLGVLSSLSLGFFLMLQREIVVGFALAWATGTLLGGVASLEFGWFFRNRRIYKI